MSRNYLTKQQFKPTPGRKIEGASLTEPGHTLTIREIFERAGVDGITPTRHLVYVDCEDVECISRLYRPGLDLTDLQQAREDLEDAQQAVDQIEQAIERARSEENAPDPTPKEE